MSSLFSQLPSLFSKIIQKEPLKERNTEKETKKEQENNNQIKEEAQTNTTDNTTNNTTDNTAKNTTEDTTATNTETNLDNKKEEEKVIENEKNTDNKGLKDTQLVQPPQQIVANVSQSFSKFSSFIVNIATKVVETIEDERHKLFTEHEKQNITEIEGIQAKPPWENLYSKDPKVVEEVIEMILDLTKSKRNFLNAPPDDSNFPFDYQTCLPVALASLQKDKRLSMARFCLVPMYISEEAFWRNWFYRVQVIKKAYAIEDKPDDIIAEKKGDKPETNKKSSDVVEVEGSAAYLDKKMEEELSQLGIHGAESSPEAWEAELKAELGDFEAKGSVGENWEEELRQELGITDSPHLSPPKEENPRTPDNDHSESNNINDSHNNNSNENNSNNTTNNNESDTITIPNNHSNESSV